jgi:hypothetical protein
MLTSVVVAAQVAAAFLAEELVVTVDTEIRIHTHGAMEAAALALMLLVQAAVVAVVGQQSLATDLVTVVRAETADLLR